MFTSGFRSAMRSWLAMTVLAIGVGAATCQAGIPPLELRWWVDDFDNPVFDGLPDGIDVGNGTYRYNDTLFDGGSGLSLDYSIVGKPDPLLSLGITMTNSTLETINIMVEALLPIDPALTEGTVIDGSAAFGLTTTKDGGTLASVMGGPAWQAFIDGAAVQDLHVGMDVHNPSLGSSGVDQDFGPVAGPAQALDSISIKVTFSLTAGASMSLTSVFNVVPAPAGLAVVAAGCLVGRRRRRA